MQRKRIKRPRIEHRAGPKRSEVSRKAILEAALTLVEERGYATLTIEGIAARARVGKQTIYRWWPSKAAVVMESLEERAEAEVPLPQTGSLQEDLAVFLSATFQGSARSAPILRSLMAEAQLDAGFAKAFLKGFISHRREALRSLLQGGVERGELPRRADLDMLIDTLFGFFWYRLLFQHAPLDERAARQLADLILGAAPV